MEAWLTRQWYGDSAPVALRPLASLYGLAVALRRLSYARGWLRTHRVGRPVLVIGNLTVGGTGKTPLVAWFAQHLSALGFKVGIVSRGYGRTQTAPRFVELNSDWREVGDEPLLLRRATDCLTVVAQDRVAGARMLIERGAELVIADDGLQHLRLGRDCEVLVVDSERGFGNGHLLPAGPLREPVSRLASVDAAVANGVAQDGSFFEMSLAAAQIMPLSPQANHAGFDAVRAHAVAGIGNPARFFRALRARGIEVIEHPFPDHHAYTQDDLRFNDDLPVLMTEKDAVKCREFADARLWYVPVTAQFSETQTRELLERVLRKLGG